MPINLTAAKSHWDNNTVLGLSAAGVTERKRMRNDPTLNHSSGQSLAGNPYDPKMRGPAG